MDIDNFVMLCILQLHSGKNIEIVDGMLNEIEGVNGISVDDIYCDILDKDKMNISIKDLKSSINRLMLKGHLSIRDERICPSLGLVYYFMEILQYEGDANESLQMLSSRLDSLETE